MIDVATKLDTVVEQKVEKNIIVTKAKKNIVYNVIKRIIDIVAGIVGIIILVPLTLIVIALRFIKNEHNGPIFYEQLRIGKNGKVFRMYKFRTMVVGADRILKKYLDENEEIRKEFEENQKLRNDPRITSIGKILRKTSLDEFPQFINVLKGDMSLVGPRPIVEREVELFGNNMKRVHSVKPGITGYWAVNGRSDTTYEERVNMETYYAENYSLGLDIKIILKTITAVLNKKGAV